MDSERLGRRVDSGSVIPRTLLRAVKTRAHGRLATMGSGREVLWPSLS